VVLVGQYTFHLKKLHDKYGPIIRINPYELHIVDPEYYDTLYASSASGEKRDKWHWSTKQFAAHGSGLATNDHDQHKVRRAALNRYFSTASVRKLQPIINRNIDLLLERLCATKDSGLAIDLRYPLAAFTNGMFLMSICS